MKSTYRRTVATCITLLALLFAPVARAAALEVTTSFSILGDFVRQVGGERVAVRVLVGPNEDTHGYQARPSDARAIGKAGLVVANGLGFDDWIVRLAKSAGFRGTVVIASANVRTLAMTHADGDAGDGGGTDRGIDPHAWQDVANAQRYVLNIADALVAADPAGAAVYRTNAARYTGQLKALDAEIRAALASLPASRRKVVSSHDAFGYFARAYDIRFLAPVGVSNNAEPTAQGVAQLIRQVRAEKVPAVFLENIADPRLIERIRSESGARVGGTLYSDALSAANGAAPDYLSMMRHNLQRLLEALALR
ncbi:MAG: zinc ABC transporter substrate-binding protein [Proteobacteria bacterium]|nr:zinc ABC transporter substrate-binding protein [Pseudomonadota bacterium]